MTFSIRPMRSLRLKVTDRCPWSCNWCHNEGTGERNIATTRDIPWDAGTRETLWRLQAALGFSEIHLTGGEPSSHPHARELIGGLSAMGFNMKMTTIGGDADRFADLARLGVSSFNFSIHSLDPVSLAATQINRSEVAMGRFLQRELGAIQAVKSQGASVKVNIVISSSKDLPRAMQVVDWAQREGVELRLLDDLNMGQRSVDAAMELLSDLHAEHVDTVRTAGVSGYSEGYKLPSGKCVVFKRIANVFLNGMCGDCRLRDTLCRERFYAVRLEFRVVDGEPQFMVRLCLHRQDDQVVMSVEDFLSDPLLAEVQHQIGYSPQSSTVLMQPA